MMNLPKDPVMLVSVLNMKLRDFYPSLEALAEDLEMDAGELMEARLAIREEKERSAVTCVQDAYGEKYDSLMMFDSKRDVANLLHEEAETRFVRERLRKKQQTKTQRQRKPKHYEQER